jgi:DNA invertase Pin-like site-specific DNA recombinase
MIVQPRSGLEWALSSTHFTPRVNEPHLNDRSFVIYYRVSTPRQERSGLGLAAQNTAVARFIRQSRGTVLQEYTEIEDGKNCDRGELRNALGACRVYGATLLIGNLDRLARNAAFIAMLIESGIDFVAADFPEANSFVKHILGIIAENEVKIMSNRRKAACAVMRARGFKFCQHLEGKRTFRPENLVAAKAEILRRDKTRAIAFAPLLRELRDAGKSINGIADELTRMEIEPPRQGKRWHGTSIERLFLLSGEKAPPKRRRKRQTISTGDEK